MSNATCLLRTACKEGLILPLWKPTNNITLTQTILRGSVYCVSLAYFFLGVSVISDKFMSAIEVITTQERKKKIKTGSRDQTISERIWNDTVSNLTLMALGSSAPEILLSTIEIVGNKFEVGELGAGTIVGSAAFNMFVIIGLCVVIIPQGQVRRISQVPVFITTSIWSLFAYIWLFLVLEVYSPNQVEIWESILTLLYFPLLVITSYLVDIRLCYRTKARSTVPKTKIAKLPQVKKDIIKDDISIMSVKTKPPRIIRIEYLNMMKDIRLKYPRMTVLEMEAIARKRLIARNHYSRAVYRINAVRSITGKEKFDFTQRDKDEDNPLSPSSVSESCRRMASIAYKELQIFEFEPDYYTVIESGRFIEITVQRKGFGTTLTETAVEYFTSDGTAVSGTDYVQTEGLMSFERHEVKKNLKIEIIDDQYFEDDEYFFVNLRNPKLIINDSDLPDIELKISQKGIATILILDDDYPGIFEFRETRLKVEESAKSCVVGIRRKYGFRGLIKVPILIENSSAIENKHFRIIHNTVIFQDKQRENTFKIDIIDENDYSKLVKINLKINQPKRPLKRKKIAAEPSPENFDKYRIGENQRCTITITEDKEFKAVIERINAGQEFRVSIHNTKWSEQFADAFIMDTEYETQSCSWFCHFVLHYLSLPWLLISAFIPPTKFLSGWITFVLSIIVIGILTAFIGDLASAFGCYIGLTDYVTAIIFVALGTSVPDTFASKIAAINEQNADSSIGNVVGSNAVNVFLGFGISWVFASCYHSFNKTKFIVSSDTIGFSVLIFTSFSLITIFCLLLRRMPCIGGELGGPKLIKYATGTLFLLFWISYLVLASMNAYCIIKI